MLINTFEQLEPEYLQHLRKQIGNVWSVGPVLPPSSSGRASRGKMAGIGEEKLLQWLESQNPSSVVYISFGSQTFLSEEQSKALACGLETNEQPFIWAIKVSPKIEPLLSDTPLDLSCTCLPKGFHERMKNRGLVIWGWAPQLLILSHPSVGAFMSHYGWNSMLESVSLGVPLVTWPMYANQHFNSKLAIKLGIRIQVCENRDGIPEKQRVEEGVILVMGKGEGKEMKKDVEKLKDMAGKAITEGGSSTGKLKDFVNEMYKFHLARKGVK
ncbi:UDP-glycosyltransferase 73C7-like [Cryptomeria japonica]|uniref:UDP-glycosyltransferase 73C7-like n=1 Tax=Cryptomeria japonica TaxID=3369 RepID=UPI0027DA6AF0|nr:UDP-glycosyltransferase 73C7-like [Cryptomeria japonica]